MSGLVLKVICLGIIILTVSTLGNFVYHWNKLPSWFEVEAIVNGSSKRTL